VAKVPTYKMLLPGFFVVLLELWKPGSACINLELKVHSRKGEKLLWLALITIRRKDADSFLFCLIRATG
jgi:hypothetical protein